MDPPLAKQLQATRAPKPTAPPTLEELDPSTPHQFLAPAKRINEGADVTHFLTSKAYRDIVIFILQLNRALCPRTMETSPPPPPAQAASGSSGSDTTKPQAQSQPRQLPPLRPRGPTGQPPKTFTLNAPRQDPESVQRLRKLLDRVEAVIDDAPPDPGPRRFGNISFRKWHALLEERVDNMLAESLDPQVLGFGRGDGDAGQEAGPIVELRAYFIGAFGSSQRLDYGTGHELSFLAFLGCLWKLGGFKDGKPDGEIERSIVLGVIERYLRVVRRLILTYTLEPAGSHGVWGLDDHSFIPYIFGSAQLARPITEDQPMPTEGYVPGAPKPSDITKSTAVDLNRGLNMYFSAIGFINDVKKGPFWEHSPILFDISGIKDGWGKINKGMIKMYNAEVLSKFPVVQHFPFGSLFSWDTDPDAPPPVQSVHMSNQPESMAPVTRAVPPPPPPRPGGVGTAAPWATAREPIPDVPPDSFPKGKRGTTSAQYAVTKAPWARD